MFHKAYSVLPWCKSFFGLICCRVMMVCCRFRRLILDAIWVLCHLKVMGSGSLKPQFLSSLLSLLHKLEEKSVSRRLTAWKATTVGGRQTMASQFHRSVHLQLAQRDLDHPISVKIRLPRSVIDHEEKSCSYVLDVSFGHHSLFVVQKSIWVLFPSFCFIFFLYLQQANVFVHIQDICKTFWISVSDHTWHMQRE